MLHLYWSIWHHKVLSIVAQRSTAWHRLQAAVQFLTLIPVRLDQPVALSQTAAFFPFVGALLGVIAGTILLLFQRPLGTPIAGLLALGALLLLTGGLHEDGLADVADACRAGRSRDTILRIMKDSRIGVYGTLAILASLLLRWQALSRCRINPVLGLAAALALSRTGLVALAAFSRAVGDGLGAAFGRHLTRYSAFGTIAAGLAIALLCAQLTGLVMACFSALTVLGARSYFSRRIGGVTGDCLGAICQIIETVNLLILAWQPAWQLAWQPSI